VNTVQPTCSIPTGTITVTSPLGSGYEYSINGTDYQSGVTFSGLAPGNYTVTVRNTSDSTCVSSGTNVTINAVPDAPANATASVVQPTCAVQTGTITVTAPLGAYQYSIDGNIYQAGTSFPGLAPGNYTVYVRSNDDNTCISSGTQVTINAVPDVQIGRASCRARAQYLALSVPRH